MGSIDYREFVVEVSGGPSGGPHNLIPTLEKLMKDKKKLHAMQEALGRHARKLVYGLDEDMYAEGDAFDELLGRLRHYLDGYWPERMRCLNHTKAKPTSTAPKNFRFIGT